MVENVFVHKKYAKIIQQYVALCCCSLYWCIVGRRGWSKVYSFPKGTWKYYHCGRLCFFYMIKLCNIRLLYKLKMEDWWPIYTQSHFYSDQVKLWSYNHNNGDLYFSQILIDDWLIVIKSRVSLIFLVYLVFLFFFREEIELFAGSLQLLLTMTMSSWLLI